MQNTGQAAPPSRVPDPKRNIHPIPPEFDAGPIMALDEPKLIAILKDPGSTAFQKAKACQRLAVIGTKDSVPPLAALLGDPHLGCYGRFGLEPNPDPSVDDAFRGALPKLKGGLLAGAINSIGQRRDPKAVDALVKLMNGPDPEVAQCAAAALGRIGGPQAAKALQEALTRARKGLLPAVAGACLVCAEGILAHGDRKQGLAFYELLRREDIPRPVRLAAMHAVIEAEISVTRPRLSGAAPAPPKA